MRLFDVPFSVNFDCRPPAAPHVCRFLLLIARCAASFPHPGCGWRSPGRRRNKISPPLPKRMLKYSMSCWRRGGQASARDNLTTTSGFSFIFGASWRHQHPLAYWTQTPRAVFNRPQNFFSFFFLPHHGAAEDGYRRRGTACKYVL